MLAIPGCRGGSFKGNFAYTAPPAEQISIMYSLAHGTRVVQTDWGSEPCRRSLSNLVPENQDCQSANNASTYLLSKDCPAIVVTIVALALYLSIFTGQDLHRDN